MAFLFPDAGAIADIGHVQASSSLASDKLREYVVYAFSSKASFFGGDFAYRFDGLSFSSPDGAGAARPQYVSEAALGAALRSGDGVHLHHGSRHAFARHVFELGQPVQVPAQGPWRIEGRPIHGDAGSVQLYGVFLDAQSGAPLPHWSVSPEDGAVEVLYEYLSDGAAYLDTRERAGADAVARALGLPGLAPLGGDDGALVSGPGAYTAGGQRHAARNLAVLGERGPSVLGAGAPEVPGAAWEAANGASSALRLRHAGAHGVQTLVFAVVSDGATSRVGITDAYAVYRSAPPGAVRAGAFPPACTVAQPGGGAPTEAVQFEGAAVAPASDAHPVYVGRLLLAAGDGGEPPGAARAARMQLPAVQVQVCLLGADGTPFFEGARLLSPANVHRSMPRGCMGSRLLQMLSVLCRQDYCASRSTSIDMCSASRARHDIRQALASEYDIAREPEFATEAVAAAVNAFFADPARRVAFLRDFNAKFPGVLTDPELPGAQAAAGVAVRDALARAPGPFAVAVYLTMDYGVPGGPGGASTMRLANVPIVFALR